MANKKIADLLNKEKYEVFVLESRAASPLGFAVHPWIVINDNGKLFRYEIRHYLNKDKSYGYLHINAQPPFQGLPLFWPINILFQKAKVLGYLGGDENSRAKQLFDKIKNSKNTYPYILKYSFIGANCATYVGWSIKDFPEIKVKLPWNAFGKNYKQ